MRFAGKVAIVTGAGQGIGESYAKALSAEGASVVVADLNEAQASRVAAEIEAKGGRSLSQNVDVADPESASAMAYAAVSEFGGIDYLVNNAAIYHGMKIESLLTVDLDYYRRFMEVNLNGALHCTRACITAMTERERRGDSQPVIDRSMDGRWLLLSEQSGVEQPDRLPCGRARPAGYSRQCHCTRTHGH